MRISCGISCVRNSSPFQVQGPFTSAEYIAFICVLIYARSCQRHWFKYILCSIWPVIFLMNMFLLFRYIFVFLQIVVCAAVKLQYMPAWKVLLLFCSIYARLHFYRCIFLSGPWAEPGTWKFWNIIAQISIWNRIEKICLSFCPDVVERPFRGSVFIFVADFNFFDYLDFILGRKYFW